MTTRPIWGHWDDPMWRWVPPHTRNVEMSPLTYRLCICIYIYILYLIIYIILYIYMFIYKLYIYIYTVYVYLYVLYTCLCIMAGCRHLQTTSDGIPRDPFIHSGPPAKSRAPQRARKPPPQSQWHQGQYTNLNETG